MFKRELINWYAWFLKILPGFLGCKIRAKLLPITIGRYSYIWDNVQIDYPRKLNIGDNSSINRGTILNCGGYINIGHDVLIGPNVTIYSQNHGYKTKGRLIRMQGYEYDEVVIEDDVWIASNVTILPGIRVGKGAVIGAGAVVTKDVAPYSVMVGNPAKKITLRK